MKSVVILLLFTFGLACNNTKEITNKTPNGETMNTRSGQQPGIPGRITFKAKVVETFDGKIDICGLSKQNVVQLEVIEILDGGSSVSNLPAKNEMILVSFLLPRKDLVSETVIEAKGRESLCPTASKTYFTINSCKILE